MRRLLITIHASLILLLVGCDTVPAPVSRPLPEGEGAHPSLGLSPFEPVDRAHTQEPGTTDIIHQAESLLIPYRLRSLLELTGRWSKVRLLPAGSRTADWRVEGRILRSDPDGIQLRMRVLDQENRLLLEKEYAHNPAKGEALFNPLFDAIISDLNQLRFQSAPNEDLARVRFASDLLPEVFSGYLGETPEGHTTLRRMPTQDDPVYQRMQLLYTREASLVDAMDAHYGRYYEAIEKPYTIWREAVSGGVKKMSRYEKRSWLDPFLLIAGELTSGGGLFVEAAGGQTAADKVYEKGRDWSSGYGEKALHLRNDLDRAGMLVTAEMKPFTVEIQGKVESLSGTAAEQYKQWRDLLGKMYTKETGISIE
ncbi:MAG: hypothetical protein ACI97B_001579 [Verrucomicrobiales bacterium]|jgi:hypothetical protein